MGGEVKTLREHHRPGERWSGDVVLVHIGYDTAPRRRPVGRGREAPLVEAPTRVLLLVEELLHGHVRVWTPGPWVEAAVREPSDLSGGRRRGCHQRRHPIQVREGGHLQVTQKCIVVIKHVSHPR